MLQVPDNELNAADGLVVQLRTFEVTFLSTITKLE